MNSHVSDLQISQGRHRHPLGMVAQVSHSHSLEEEGGGSLRSGGFTDETPECPEGFLVRRPFPRGRTSLPTWRTWQGEGAALPMVPSPGEGPGKPSAWRYIDAHPGTSGGRERRVMLSVAGAEVGAAGLHTLKNFLPACFPALFPAACLPTPVPGEVHPEGV